MKEAMADQEWVDVMQLLPVFGAHSRLAFEYVEKFSIHPVKEKVKKILRLLTDLAGLFKTGKFILNRLEYDVSQRGIIEALTEINNRNFEQPLVNHNYLKKVLTSIAEKERDERRYALDKDLQRREENARRGMHQPGRAYMTMEERPLCSTDEAGEYLSAEETRKRAGELVKQISERAG